MTHYKEVGTCGHVVSQCRCPSEDKAIRKVDRLCYICEQQMKEDILSEHPGDGNVYG